MLSSMPSSRLAKGAPNDAMFFTTVGAARYFVELRMKGKYRDLMALVEFGDQAYVITPFTTDYENILFSMSLIGDWTEFMAFPDQGTVIANAIEQSVGLVPGLRRARCRGQRDGDLHRRHRRRSHRRRAAARSTCCRTRARPTFRSISFAPACPAAGSARRSPTRRGRRRWRGRAGKFLTTPSTSPPIVRAVNEIDRAAPGRVEMKRYRRSSRGFPASFALIAAAFWARRARRCG